MEKKEKEFREYAEKKAFDRDHRRVIRHNMGQYDQAVSSGQVYYKDVEIARLQASGLKDYCFQEWENLLVRFEKNARGNGCEVYWASDSDDVIKVLGGIIASEDVGMVVKMKSMLSEEIELDSFLRKSGIEAFETDLGEFIVQVAGEKPYHILTPAMHKSKESIATLFHEKFQTAPEARPEEITMFVRNYLREKFMTAGMGITGANFLIPETGSVALTENEGNGMMTFSWPKTLVVIAGMERILPELEDLGLFWPLLAHHGTGQQVTAYNTILSGPKKEMESDGPERMAIILYDGGRTRLYAEPIVDQSLKCIRCGACLNACPVYKNIGGHSYQTVYTGPIGSVISMYLDHSREAGFLNFASSLCGKCSEVCPVKIPIHRLLLENRNKIISSTDSNSVERFFFRYFRKMMMKRKNMEKFNARWKNRAMNSMGIRVWGPRREPLVFARESFNQLWKKKEYR